MKPLAVFLRLLVLVIAISTTAIAAPVPSVNAKHISGAITLDGKLDEPAWREAQSFTLTQQAPRPGQPTPYRTDVRVLVTSDAIYFGFICHDPKLGAIAIHSMRRDGDQSGDDTSPFVLDTYGDHRTGYFFQINAAGAHVDGLIDDPQNISLDWDGIWDARTAKTQSDLVAVKLR